LQRTEVKDGKYDDIRSDPAYAEAFRDYNLPVSDLEPDEAARRIAASAVREQLLAALVDWANIQTDAAQFKKLAALVRLADDDPWRKQVLFDSLDRQEWPRVARLAQQPETLRLLPARLLT